MPILRWMDGRTNGRSWIHKTLRQDRGSSNCYVYVVHWNKMQSTQDYEKTLDSDVYRNVSKVSVTVTPLNLINVTAN